MPGISFLFKKRFHPMRIDNQKKLFIAEESRKQDYDRERELAEQVVKEKELLSYEGLGKAPEHDPRASSLRFMYSAPQAKQGKETEKDKKKVQHLLEPPRPTHLDENGDDEQVRAFKQKLLLRMNPTPADRNEDIADAETVMPGANRQGEEEDGLDDDDNDGDAFTKKRMHQQSALEKATGKRQRAVLTGEEQAERHPLLKHAPVEGSYTQHIQLKHKPFNAVIRNIRCARCGEWGHQTGDRECVLRDHNPNDYARQMREDPMNNMAFESSNRSHAGDFQIDPDDSDPETTFLNTLTRREKKLLLRKLQVGGSSSPLSSSSSSSSSSSDNSDNSSRGKRKKRSSRHDKKKKAKKNKSH